MHSDALPLPRHQSRDVIEEPLECSARKWTRPQPLLTPFTTRRRAARSPSIAGDTDLYIVGNDLLFFDQPVTVEENLTAWRVGRGSIGAPGRRLFVSPKAILDSSGRLHVVWGEPDTNAPEIAPYKWSLVRTSSIWSATYDPLRGWSRPMRVYSGSIGWDRATVGAVSPRANEEGLIVVPDHAGGVIVLQLRDGKWDVARVGTTLEPAYASVLALATRRLLAIVAADAPAQNADRTSFHDVNSVGLFGADARGAWRPLVRLQRSGDQPAMELKLLEGAEGRVHLVWRQIIRGDSFAIRHIESHDGGDSWSEPSDLLPGRAIQNLRAAADACGRVHVIYEDWREGSAYVRLGYATWDSRWSKPQPLHPGYIAAEAALHRRADGALFLAFLGTHGRPEDRRGWEMFYSEFR